MQRPATVINLECLLKQLGLLRHKCHISPSQGDFYNQIINSSTGRISRESLYNWYTIISIINFNSFSIYYCRLVTTHNTLIYFIMQKDNGKLLITGNLPIAYYYLMNVIDTLSNAAFNSDSVHNYKGPLLSIPGWHNARCTAALYAGLTQCSLHRCSLHRADTMLAAPLLSTPGWHNVRCKTLIAYRLVNSGGLIVSTHPIKDETGRFISNYKTTIAVESITAQC